MRFLKSVFISFTVWVLASLLNALLMGTMLSFLSHQFKSWPPALGFTLFFTLLFALPGILVFWVVMLLNWDEDILFRSLLKVGFIVSALSSIVLYVLPLGLSKQEMFLLSLCIVTATISSIMIHHSKIVSIQKNLLTHA